MFNLLGTLCTLLLLTPVAPVGFERSDAQLVDESQPVVITATFSVLMWMHEKASAIAVDMMQVPICRQERVQEVGEVKGIVQDGYILHEPAPT